MVEYTDFNPEGSATVRRKATPPKIRSHPSLANFADCYIFVISGSRMPIGHNAGTLEGTVDMYDIESDTWDTPPVPSLNTPREAHSSCCVGEMMYVIGGMKEGDQFLDTME